MGRVLVKKQRVGSKTNIVTVTLPELKDEHAHNFEIVDDDLEVARRYGSWEWLFEALSDLPDGKALRVPTETYRHSESIRMAISRRFGYGAFSVLKVVKDGKRFAYIKRRKDGNIRTYDKPEKSA